MKPSWVKWRVIVPLFIFAFTMMLGDNLYPGALLQVLEDVICDDYYRRDAQRQPLPPDSNTTTSSLVLSLATGDCKVQPVQAELAFVRGFQQMAPVFAGLLCTVPYGMLTERIGRKRVLVLSGAGVFASLSWVLAVCYWRFLPIRWVWLSGAFLFIGGGDAVTSSVVHVMVTDATNHAERAQIFLYLHAADVIAGFFGPAISAPLMEGGHAWPVLLMADIVLFTGAFLLTRAIPETLHLKDDSSNGYRDETSEPVLSPQTTVPSSPTRSASPSSATPRKSTEANHATIHGLLASLLSVLTSNRQALLLLCIFAPQTGARELFNMIGLQYSNAKYSLPYAQGNVFISFFQAAQGLFVLVLLPVITRVIADPRGWTAWKRDRLYTILSIAATAAGLMAIAVAPTLVVVAAGLLLVALGSCTTGMLISLLGRTVRPDQVSAVYSLALTLSIVVRSLMGPVVNGLLVKGLELGWYWIGLPFGAMAVLMLEPKLDGLSNESSVSRWLSIDKMTEFTVLANANMYFMAMY
ncbi:hypothetical protein ACO1O0_002777 [Amphichorda felina]